MSPLPAFHVTAGALCGGALAQIGSGGAPSPDVALSEDEVAWWSQLLGRANEPNPDFNAALAVAAAVTMAVYAAQRTGTGQRVETRMMLSNAYALAEHFVDFPGRPARRFPDANVLGLDARNRLYETADGWVFLAAPGDRDLARLRAALGEPTLPEPILGDPVLGEDGELGTMLADRFRKQDAATWERQLTAHGIACVQVHDGAHAAYIFDAPWAQQLGFVDTAAASGFGPYLRYGRTVATTRDVGPLGAADVAGAQTRSLLAEIGYADDTIDALLANGTVGVAVR
jgi:crotonobetainyl-CoA:carnitine CoA-transferase CaiB-like acyl-CoA transferase